jgi:hypothetical protein
MARAKIKRKFPGTTKSGERGQGTTRTASDLDRSLALILAALAQLLLKSGLGFGHLAKMARVAYVNAAREMDNDKKKKVTIARIAASTGLTRLEVSRIVRQRLSDAKNVPRSSSRAARVAAGWISDPIYSTSRGPPKALPFEGSGATFSSLVRKYSGDIPARAMLTEMNRLRMVQQDKDDVIRLLRLEENISPATVSTLRAIYPWVSALAQSAQIRHSSSLTLKTVQIPLSFDSIPQVLAAIRSLNERRDAFVESVSQLSSNSRRRNMFKVDVTIAVAAARPSRIAITKQTRKPDSRK